LLRVDHPSVRSRPLRFRLAAQRERVARERLQSFMDHAPAVIFVKDLAGRHLSVNRRFTALHSPEGADLVGRTDAEIFGAETAAEMRKSDMAVVTSGVPETLVEGVDRPEGRRHYETIKFPIRDEAGAIAGVAGIALDVTDRVVAEQEREEALRQLAHRALHDPLTGLPNRVLLAERLEEALARATEDGTVLAVLLVDLDQFKNVNDSLGHHTGDELLTQVAPRLRAAAGPADTVARFGGDEFVVLCEGLAGPWEALEAARRLSAAWAEPFRLGDDDVYISGSAGVAVAHAGRADAAALLREADAAMYRAKERGRGNVELYDEVMRARAYDRLRLEGDLRRALAHGDIEIAYQPIVDLRDGRPLAVEALARWTHPERGPVSPASFIPMAEESGLIAELGRHVLRTACVQVARWRAEVPGAEELQLSVNVSARQIARGELPGDVKDALREAGLPPHALALEVTESALMEETDAPGPVLAALRGLGVQIVLDDFGTGYSSLSYLRRFPLDGIKLDRSFVDGMAQPEAAAVVAAILGMGATLGLAMTAEGIETREQAERLRELGCRRGQGYLLARPLRAAEAGAVLADRLRRRPSLGPAAGTARAEVT
jgi:diguanylate cyclase (GGDEF)-like protein/PAS domain S-box-containing protein